MSTSFPVIVSQPAISATMVSDHIADTGGGGVRVWGSHGLQLAIVRGARIVVLIFFQRVVGCT